MKNYFVSPSLRHRQSRQQYVFRNRYFLLFDLVVLLVTPTLALILRLDGFERVPSFAAGLAAYTLLAVLVHIPFFYNFGLYQRVWRYASIEELLQIIMAVGLSTMLVIAIFFAFRSAQIQSLQGASSLGDQLLPISTVPRSIPFISALLVLLFVGGGRFAVRLLATPGRNNTGRGDQKAVIAGAGDAGAMIARELQNSSQATWQAAAFVDDDAKKHGMYIHGVPVLGNRNDIPQITERLGASQVIIAMPTASGKTIREIVSICEQSGIETKIIPGIYELLDGTVRVDHLRDVEIVDLLRREPVHTDTTAVEALIKGKRVLVTGGGGSVGSELCRQVKHLNPAELIILGHGENSVINIVRELLPDNNKSTPSTQIRAVIADIRSLEHIDSIFKQYCPDIVFHAAAHKHVPLMEANPCEAVSNNIIGTRNLLSASLNNGVDRFVMISTDKAVNPTAIMGASKRVSELLVHQAARKSGRPYVAVRFGNVLGSRGSVIPRFKEQIAAGGPVTVTDPDMKRFFMTIPEAVQLVLQAAALGNGDEVFVLDMGEPVKIVDLATDLIRLSGLEVGQDIDIAFTSVRPGEKLEEELFGNGEEQERTQHEKIFIARDGSKRVPVNLDVEIDQLELAARRNDNQAVIEGLHLLLPEFRLATNGRQGDTFSTQLL